MRQERLTGMKRLGPTSRFDKKEPDDNVIFESKHVKVTLDDLVQLTTADSVQEKVKLERILTELELKDSMLPRGALGAFHGRPDMPASEKLKLSILEARRENIVKLDLDPWKLLPKYWRDHLIRHQRILDEKEARGGTGAGSEYDSDPWSSLPQMAQKYLRKHQRILDESKDSSAEKPKSQ